MFKNLTVYKVTGMPASVDALETALAAMPFEPCDASQDKALGWVPPRGQAHGPLVESVNGQWMLRFKVEMRQVPASVIKRRVDEQAAQIEATTGRKPGKKEKRDLKEEAMAALLPQAFPREQSIWVWLDTTHHRLVLDTTSAAQSDDIITALVKALDGFSVQSLNPATSPAVAMALWLTEQEAPTGFAIGKECELKSADESLQLKKLALDDKVLEQAKAQDQRADDFDGNVLMATAELGPLITDLIDALGGEAA